MDRIEIQYLLRRKGLTQKDIAREVGMSEAFVSQVISGARRNERIQDLIADKIGRERTELFPVKAA